MSLSHIGISVPPSKFSETVTFYKAALLPLGFTNFYQPNDNVIGLGNPNPSMWIAVESEKAPATGYMHIAFYTHSRSKIHQFHSAALKAGAKDNGAPGLRPQYMPSYYAAYVIDPVGNNLEVMTCTPGGKGFLKAGVGAVVVGVLAVVGGWVWGWGRW